MQQQVAQRSPDLDAAPAEPAQTRQDIAAPEMERNAQEQQSAAATAGTPMATAPAADPVASTGPPRNGAEAVAVADAPRMTPTTATLRTPGDVADTAASTGPPRDGAATVAVTDPTRVPATTEALQVQVDFARAGAQAGRPQPGAVNPGGGDRGHCATWQDAGRLGLRRFTRTDGEIGRGARRRLGYTRERGATVRPIRQRRRVPRQRPKGSGGGTSHADRDQRAERRPKSLP